MGFSFWQVLIVLVIVLLLFGTKKLRNVGGDLGGAIKGFKQAMKEGEDEKSDDKPAQLEKNEQASSANTETTEQKDQHKS